MDNETLQYILSYIDKKFETLLKQLGSPATLPIASTTSFGGIVVGDRLFIDVDTGKLSADTQTPPNVTTGVNGLMLATDKAKLDSIDIEEVNGNELFDAIFHGYTMPQTPLAENESF